MGSHQIRAVAAAFIIAAGPLAKGSGGQRPDLAAGTIYVDTTLKPPFCATYDPASRACGAGRAVAYRLLSAGVAAAGPGSSVLMRAGTYTEALVPSASGTKEMPI